MKKFTEDSIENDKIISELQQKVCHISNLNIDEFIEKSKKAAETIIYMQKFMQEISSKSVDKFEAIPKQVENLSNNKDVDNEYSKLKQIDKVIDQDEEQLADLSSPKGKLSPIKLKSHKVESEVDDIEERKVRRQMAIYPDSKDPQKVLQQKLRQDIKKHTSNRILEFKQVFKDKSSKKGIEENTQGDQSVRSLSKHSLTKLQSFRNAVGEHRKSKSPSKINRQQTISMRHQKLAEESMRLENQTRTESKFDEKSLDNDHIQKELNSDMEIMKDQLNETMRTKRSMTSKRQRDDSSHPKFKVIPSNIPLITRENMDTTKEVSCNVNSVTKVKIGKVAFLLTSRTKTTQSDLRTPQREAMTVAIIVMSSTL